MAFLPATPTIGDLPTGTTLTGSELLMAVQTANNVGQSIQITVQQVASAVATTFPTSTLVTASNGLSASGSTTIALSLATVTGLCIIGNTSNATTVPSAIVGTADQVMIINHAGSSAIFGAVNLGASAAVTGTLSTTYLPFIPPALLTGTVATANLPAINVGSTGGGGITGQAFFQPATGLPVAGSSTVGIKVSSAANLGIYVGSGTPTFTAGTGSLYLNGGAVTATSRLYINTNGGSTWANFTASL